METTNAVSWILWKASRHSAESSKLCVNITCGKDSCILHAPAAKEKRKHELLFLQMRHYVPRYRQMQRAESLYAWANCQKWIQSHQLLLLILCTSWKFTQVRQHRLSWYNAELLVICRLRNPLSFRVSGLKIQFQQTCSEVSPRGALHWSWSGCAANNLSLCVGTKWSKYKGRHDTNPDAICVRVISWCIGERART